MIDHNEISAGLNTLEKLRRDLESIGEKNKSVFKENDLRFYFPNQLNRILIFNDLNLSYFERTIRNKNILDDILLSSSVNDHFEVMKSYIYMVRLSLVIGLCTVLERYIRKLVEIIEKKELKNENIYRLRQRLFAKMKIKEEDDLWIAQILLFNIRNTIHNNGIFTDKFPFEKVYGGGFHSFKFGEIHSSADFRTMSFIVRDIIEFYKKTLEITEIKQKKHIPEIF